MHWHTIRWLFWVSILIGPLGLKSQPLRLESKGMRVETIFEENGTYYGNLALRMRELPPKAKQVSINFFFKELVREGAPALRVDRGLISLPKASISLTTARWTNLRITFKGLSLPGRYKGSFLLSYTFDQKIFEKRVPVEITLLDDRQPVLGSGAPATLQLVARSSWLDPFFPNTQSPDTLAIPIENPSSLPLNLGTYQVKLAHQTRAGIYLDHQDFPLIDTAWTLDANTKGLLYLTHDAKPLFPGTYKGELIVQFKDESKNAISIPLTINVKIGLTLAIIFLLVGIISGRILKTVDSAEGRLQISLVQEKLQIEGLIRSIDEAEGRNQLLTIAKSLDPDISNASTEA
ncbi:MAG: hypothetical protein AAFV07_20940, partial [Bacteroidota bacterium]